MSGETSEEGRSFEVFLPRTDPVAVIVHVPHAGRWIPVPERAGIVLDDAALARELLLMTDHHTDWLWADASDVGATAFVNRLSRLVVDPERFPDGAEPMEQVGMGAVYTRTAHQQPLRHLADDGREQLLDRWFRPYAVAFAQQVDRLLEAHGTCVIVDAHSYPHAVLPYERRREAARPQVCVGTEVAHTPAWLCDAVVEACDRGGYDVAFDTPFRGYLCAARPLSTRRQGPFGDGGAAS